jgi:hypothetical protein
LFRRFFRRISRQKIAPRATDGDDSQRGPTPPAKDGGHEADPPTYRSLDELALWGLLVALEDAERAGGADSPTAREEALACRMMDDLLRLKENSDRARQDFGKVLAEMKACRDLLEMFQLMHENVVSSAAAHKALAASDN